VVRPGESLTRRLQSGIRGTERLARQVATHIQALPDLVANQATLARHLAVMEQGAFSRPCACPPLSSRACCQADCGAEYAAWLNRLGLQTVINRKFWEYAAIGRALDAGGMLSPGRRGVGFGVGREPLVAAFAAAGCQIVATDLHPDDSRAGSWARTNQHCLSLAGLQRPAVCPEDRLAAQVEIRAVDMNDIPAGLGGFDFCWSSCALEHLGSIDAGLDFIQRAMACLRPGGLAVHTTEFNLDSDTGTVMAGETVVYRRQDLARLGAALGAAGHHSEPFEVPPPTGVLDSYIDIRPYQYAALLLRIGGYRATSAVVVAQAGPRPAGGRLDRSHPAD
jgi:SAM-dependent methyltransferase